MIKNCFKLESPALVSFSGGRTSGYMLYQILQAHGGELPSDVFVVFANTGKERPETLQFIADCSENWGIKIYWVEWRDKAIEDDRGFADVNFYTASRNGEPFHKLIVKKQLLPNVVTRYCTEKLKIETMQAFMKAQGVKAYNNVIGLRYDEPHRVHRNKQKHEAQEQLQLSLFDAEPSQAKPSQVKPSLITPCYPLYEAQVTIRDIKEFWADDKQGFDLQLKSYEGNCDLCFLKGLPKLIQIMHEKPALSEWWQEQEKLRLSSKPAGAQFKRDVSYKALQWIANNQENYLDKIKDGDLESESTIDCFCTD